MNKAYIQNLLRHPASGAWFLLGLLFGASLIMLWPGVMSPDAGVQYAAAMDGIYSDHHPPLMSFVWRYLARIYPGSAPMFVFHIGMLYLAAAILIYIFRTSKFKWWYAIYPVLPNIVAYTALIVKDTGFTFSYLLSGAIMAYLIMENVQKRRWFWLIPVLVLLFYGTAVKFQAKYLLIFFTLAVAYCAYNYRWNFKTIVTGVGLYFAILASILTVNAKLVPAAHEAHSWQWVKIYDLSGITLKLHQPMYPDFILQQPNFNFAQVGKLFEPREVDPLVFTPQAVIHGGTNAKQRAELWNYWFKTMLKHPWLYLQVRFKLFSYDLITAPCERNDPVKFLQSTTLAPILSLPLVGATIDAGYTVFKVMLRFVWLLPLLFIYMFAGFKYFRSERAAGPILLLSCTSFALLAVLFFCSMAGTARYVFLCTCLVHASHGFTYILLGKKIGFRLFKPKSYHLLQTFKSPS